MENSNQMLLDNNEIVSLDKSKSSAQIKKKKNSNQSVNIIPSHCTNNVREGLTYG